MRVPGFGRASKSYNSFIIIALLDDWKDRNQSTKRVGWLEFRYLNKELAKGQSSLLRTRIAEVKQQLSLYQGAVAKGVYPRGISRTDELVLPEVHL